VADHADARWPVGPPRRGSDLFAHDEWMQECLTHSEGLLYVATLRTIWAAMREFPRGDTPDVINHSVLFGSGLRRWCHTAVDDVEAGRG
jgi:hypothetical protein